MEAFWKIVVSVTGIAGVGAFVFYGLYKNWLKLPAFASLTRDQRYRLFIIFLILTFAFAVLALGLSAYEGYLKSAQAETSTRELLATLEGRYQRGHAMLEGLKQKFVNDPKTLSLISIGESEYESKTAEARVALQQRQFMRFHELNKEILDFVSKIDGMTPQERAKFIRDACELPPSEKEKLQRLQGDFHIDA